MNDFELTVPDLYCQKKYLLHILRDIRCYRRLSSHNPSLGHFQVWVWLLVRDPFPRELSKIIQIVNVDASSSKLTVRMVTKKTAS